MAVFIQRRLRQIRPIERTDLGKQKRVGRTDEPSLAGVRIRYHQRPISGKMRPLAYEQEHTGEGSRRFYLYRSRTGPLGAETAVVLVQSQSMPNLVYRNL